MMTAATESAPKKRKKSAKRQAKVKGLFKGKIPHMKLEESLGMHRKNMEALSSMGKTSMDAYQNIAKLQMGFFQQMMADMQQAFQQSLAAKSVNDCVSKGTAFCKDRLAKTMTHVKSVSGELGAGRTKVTHLAKNHAATQMHTLKNKFKRPSK
ncbi:MAG: phasin family protein [Holosporales bacterium]|jgi:hypothetical protein|nr:phasin family protein [Holosporales bacterium]